MADVVPVSGARIDPVALKNSLDHSSVTREEKIDKATQQFEAIFLRQYLGDSLKPMFKGYLNEGGSINDTYRYFITDVLADRLASQKVFGLGQKLSEQLTVDQARRTPSAEGGSDATPPAKVASDKGLGHSSDIRSLGNPSDTLGTPNAISSLEKPYFKHFSR